MNFNELTNACFHGLSLDH